MIPKILIFFILLCSYYSGYAQIASSGRQVSVHGHITCPPGTTFDTLVVRLTGSAAYIPSSYVFPNGEFQFDSVNPGSYLLELTDVSGNRITQQLVTIDENNNDIAIALPEPRGSRPITGTVSLFELAHKVPGKAKKELQLAEKASSKKDMDGCLGHLQAAVEIDPEYLEARRQLGLCYMRLEQPEKIIETFSEVLKRDPRSAVAYAGISAAHLLMSKFSEAESAARRAMSFNPVLVRARYVLGLSLASQNKNHAEALELMTNTADAIPAAHFVAAQLLARQGEMDRARAEVKAYLGSGETSHQKEATEWLGELDRQFPPETVSDEVKPGSKSEQKPVAGKAAKR
jgi:tetratricopeptide (TPR) repeat protein